MNEEVLIPICLFATIFGVAYLYLSTRNKERLALIEKGADANLFNRKSNSLPKVTLLNLALLFVGIGSGVFSALLLSTYTTLNEDALYPALIFLMAGIALLIGFKLTKNLDK